MTEQEILKRLEDNYYDEYMQGSMIPMQNLDFTSIVLDILNMSYNDLHQYLKYQIGCDKSKNEF